MDAATEPRYKPTELEMSRCKYRVTALEHKITPLCQDCAGCMVMVNAIDAEVNALNDDDTQYDLVSPGDGTRALAQRIQQAASDIKNSEVPGPNFEHDEMGLAFAQIFEGMARLSEVMLGCIPTKSDYYNGGMKIPLFFYRLNKEFGI